MPLPYSYRKHQDLEVWKSLEYPVFHIKKNEDKVQFYEVIIEVLLKQTYNRIRWIDLSINDWIK